MPSRIPTPAACPARHFLRFLAATALLPCLAAQVPTDDEFPDPALAQLKRLSIEELMAVEVTSVSRRTEKLSEAAASVQVIGGPAIRRSGAASLPEAMRLAGTLHVAQRGAGIWSISARGFNTELANKLLVMMDGRAVYTPLFSGVFWQRQDYLLEDIERIEVVNGPGGTLWGANAVNGVISITSKHAADTQGWYAEAGAGTELRRSGAVRYGGEAAPGVHYRIYAKYADGDGAERADGAPAGDEWDFRQAGFRVDASLAGDSALTVQGDIFERRTGATLGGIEGGGNVLGRWTRTGADGSEVAVKAYFDRTRLTLRTDPFVINGIPLAPAGTFRDALDTVDVDFQHRLPPGDRHQLIWGLGARFTRDRVGNSPALAFTPTELDQWLWSAFFQDEIRLRETVKLSVGTKVEHNDYTGFEAEPGIRVEWQPDDQRMLWAAVSRAVRMPSRIDRDVSQPAPGSPLIILEGGPDFDSETVVAWEVGARAQPGDRTVVSVSAFHNEYRNLRSTSATPATILPFFFANNLEGSTSGLEASVAFQAAPAWQLHAIGTLFDHDLRVTPGAFDFNNALNETADPRWQLTLRSALDLPRGWMLDGALRWVDSFTANNAGVPVNVPGYAELDVRIGWQATDRVDLSVSARNLLHARHPEYGLPGPGRVEVERGFHAKISWRY